MESVSTRLDNETYRLISETADERGMSMAEVLRELIEKGREYDGMKRDYEERIDELETTVERLENEKRLILEDREEKQELVRYVEEQRSIEQYRARREQMVDEASLLQRAKWKLTGVPVDGDTSE